MGARGVDVTALDEFAPALFARFGSRVDSMSPKPFGSGASLLAMITRPIDAL